MNLFTNGQNDRMQSLFAPGGERVAMLSSNALTATPLNPIAVPGLSDSFSVLPIFIYPNPAVNQVSVQLSEGTTLGATLEVYNQIGQKVMSCPVNVLLLQLNINALNKGVYYIKNQEWQQHEYSQARQNVK